MDDEAEKFLGNKTVMRKEICAETVQKEMCAETVQVKNKLEAIKRK